MKSANFSDFLSPPPCLHLDKISIIKFMQPPSLRLLPMIPSPPMQTSYLEAPQCCEQDTSHLTEGSLLISLFSQGVFSKASWKHGHFTANIGNLGSSPPCTLSTLLRGFYEWRECGQTFRDCRSETEPACPNSTCPRRS